MGKQDIQGCEILHHTIPSTATATANQMDMEIKVFQEDQNLHMAAVHG